MNKIVASNAHDPYVPESAFGKWFQQTDTWKKRVLERTLVDLEALIPDRRASYDVIVDVGCGWGFSLKKLDERFHPKRLIGFDIEMAMLKASQKEAQREGIKAEYIQGSSSSLQLDDNSVDILFCHQTFHHLIYQEQAINEFLRVLKPGGLMLFAESTRRYINSWSVRWFFRHPMAVQKSAPEYLQLIRDAGFEVAPESILYPFLWWSREDLGLMELCLGIKPPVDREETLIYLVARKP